MRPHNCDGYRVAYEYLPAILHEVTIGEGFKEVVAQVECKRQLDNLEQADGNARVR